MKLAWKLLRRDWQAGELRLIAAALVMSVAVVSGVTLLADRVERGLIAQSSQLLAGDLSISGSREIDPGVLERAAAEGLETSRSASFASMIFSGDDSHLASVRVVERNFPLRGNLVVTTEPFASDFSAWQTLQEGPPAGEIWVEERLLPLLDIELGDRVEIGRAELTASRILVSEPDSGSFASLLGARVLMNRDDLERADVIQPGSRISYQLLVAGEEPDVRRFRDWAERDLEGSYRVSGPERAERRLERTIENGRSFLVLAGSVGVMLAGVALAMASRRYTERHVDQVALWKSWGESRGDVARLYLQQLAILTLAATLAGLLIGWALQEALLLAIRSFLPEQMPRAALAALWTGAVTGPLCLAGFALPAFWRLLDVSPLQMLRRDLPFRPVSGLLRAAIGLGSILAVVTVYGGELDISGMFFSGLIAVVVLTGVIGFVLLRVGRTLGRRGGKVWRLATSSLWRRRSATLVQLVAFGATLMLLLVMLAVRTSLIEEWQLQLSPDAPNHFLVNIPQWELEGVQQQVGQYGLEVPDWYPMVRGRLVAINDRELSDDDRRRADVSRELNLTSARELPVENRIVAGAWFTGEQRPLVSVERETAEALGLALGDSVTFDIGGLRTSAEVSSLRDLQWESMTPNFFFIFSPGSLAEFPVSYMTSVYVPPEQRRFVSDLLRAHPTVLVIAIDQILEQLRRVVSQVTSALQLMLLAILACGLLVLFAAVSTSLAERLREGALLRALGSSRRLILGMLAIEFGTLGLIAGLTAATGAELVTTQIQLWVFDMTPRWHPQLWLVGPLSGALVIGFLGIWSSRAVVRVSPLESLAAQ